MSKGENLGKKERIHSRDKDEWKDISTRRSIAPGRGGTRGTNPRHADTLSKKRTKTLMLHPQDQSLNIHLH
jgi:hypothetical protein